jgi:hypothetical protein
VKATSSQSGASRSGLQKPVDPVEHFVFNGLQKRIFDALEVKCVWLTGPDKLPALQALFGNQNAGAFDYSSVQYPYGFLTMQSWEEDTERGNTHYMARKGFPVALDDSGNRAFYARIIPVKMTVKFECVHNSNSGMINFIKMLFMARRDGWLKFNVAYGRTTLEVSVYPEPNATIPQRADSPDMPKDFAFEGTLDVRGFLSLPVLNEQQVITSVENDGFLAADAQAAPEANTQIWSFKR